MRGIGRGAESVSELLRENILLIDTSLDCKSSCEGV